MRAPASERRPLGRASPPGTHTSPRPARRGERDPEGRPSAGTRAGAAATIGIGSAAALAIALGAPGTTPPTTADLFRAGLLATWALLALSMAARSARIPRWPLAGGISAAASLFAANRIAASPGLVDLHASARAVADLSGPVLVAAVLHLLLSAPSGRLGSTTRRAGAAAGYAVAVIAGAIATGTGQLSGRGATLTAWVAVLGIGLTAVRRRHRTGGGRDRERLNWQACGLVLAAGLAALAAASHLLTGWPSALGMTMTAVSIVIPVGLIVAEIRTLGRLGGRVLVMMLLVTGVGAGAAVTYVAVVLGFDGGTGTGAADRRTLGFSLLATAIVAAGFVPVRERIRAWATRFVYGAREAPDEVLRTFSSRMTRAVPLDELQLQLAESLHKALRLASAEVYTGADVVLERTASVPVAAPRAISLTPRERAVITRAGVSGSAWASVWLPALLEGRPLAQLRVAPVSNAGELFGLIVVERGPDADAFAPDDDRMLAELARQLGLTTRNASLDAELATTMDELRRQAEELRQSRARVVASADAERRRLERDLHDGAQQNLVAVAVNLRLAAELLPAGADAAADLLGQLSSQVGETIRELRELAHGIYPPLLADSGLPAALGAAANRSPLSVTVLADQVGRYPAEVEAAVYFCCLEALQNAAKHAAGASVEIKVWAESGGLLFSVTDSGPGFRPEQVHSGHGYTNMADRLGAIGGSVRWESEPGRGTRVLGAIPLL